MPISESSATTSKVIVYTIGRLYFGTTVIVIPFFSLVFLTIRLASASLVSLHRMARHRTVTLFFFIDHGRPAGWFVGGQQASQIRLDIM